MIRDLSRADGVETPKQTFYTMSSNESSGSESFEQSLSRLEELTRALEDPDTGLDDAIDLYEKGTVLAKQCMERLSAAELRVEKLQQRLTDPEPEAEEAQRAEIGNEPSGNTLFS